MRITDNWHLYFLRCKCLSQVAHNTGQFLPVDETVAVLQLTPNTVHLVLSLDCKTLLAKVSIEVYWSNRYSRLEDRAWQHSLLQD